MTQGRLIPCFNVEWLLPYITRICGSKSYSSQTFSDISPEAGKTIRGAGEALPALSSHVGEERLAITESRTLPRQEYEDQSAAFIKEVTLKNFDWDFGGLAKPASLARGSKLFVVKIALNTCGVFFD